MENKPEEKLVNARIVSADIRMDAYACLYYDLHLKGFGFEASFGRRKIGFGYLEADEFIGSAKGTEALMRIMDVVGVEKWSDLNGKYVRVVDPGWGNAVWKIGNIIDNKWFDQMKFFRELDEEEV